MAVLKLDSSEFLLVMMPVLAISSWEYSSLIKMRRWLAKAFIRFSSDGQLFIF